MESQWTPQERKGALGRRSLEEATGGGWRVQGPGTCGKLPRQTELGRVLQRAAVHAPRREWEDDPEGGGRMWEETSRGGGRAEGERSASGRAGIGRTPRGRLEK